MKVFFAVFLTFFCFNLFAGEGDSPKEPRNSKDTTSMHEEQVEHAEPVFFDFIGELGALRGENEANINFHYRDLETFNNLITQVEVEFIPVNRLGFELVLPFQIFFDDESAGEAPSARIPGFAWGAQYSFLVSEERNFSLAASYRNTFTFRNNGDTLREDRIEQIVHFPFISAGKNWNEKLHFSFFAGSQIIQKLDTSGLDYTPHVTLAFHQQFAGDHFWGLEFNNEIEDGELEVIARPQLIFNFMKDYRLGAAIGLPLVHDDQNWSAFLRLSRDF